MNRQERLQEVFNYLVYKHQVKSQKDFAEQIGRSANNVSKAMHGDARALTDNFLRRIAETFRPTFNLGWMLTGEGQMLNADMPGSTDEINQPISMPTPPAAPSSPSAQTPQIAGLDTLVNDLRSELREIRDIRTGLQTERLDLQRAITAFESARADTIEMLARVEKALRSSSGYSSLVAEPLGEKE